LNIDVFYFQDMVGIDMNRNNRIGRSVRKYVSIIFKLITEFKHVDESTCYDYNKSILSMGNVEVERMEIDRPLRL
jgi:hypothetical protein